MKMCIWTENHSHLYLLQEFSTAVNTFLLWIITCDNTPTKHYSTFPNSLFQFNTWQSIHYLNNLIWTTFKVNSRLLCHRLNILPLIQCIFTGYADKIHLIIYSLRGLSIDKIVYVRTNQLRVLYNILNTRT